MSAPSTTISPTARLGARTTDTLPLVCGVLIALNALYVLLVAFGNITDYTANQAFVQHVMAMDTTNFGAPAGTGLDPDVMWRANTDPLLQNAAYLSVIAWEAAAAVVLIVATTLWVRQRGTARTTARFTATAGLLMIVVLFFGGFIDLGGEWFQMWRSTTWNGLDPAFRNCVLALLTLVLLHLPAASRTQATS
jgi:predicted small integral membrane protein